MNDPLDRVRRLIQLAKSTSENESRNAAFQACELIHAHDLIVVNRVAYERLLATVMAARDEADALRAASTAARAAASAPAVSVPPPVVVEVVEEEETPKRKRRRSREGVSDIVSSAAGKVVTHVVRDFLGVRR